MSNRELSADFLASFKSASSEVAQALEAASPSAEAFTKTQIALVKLRRALVMAEDYLPRYDQRRVDEQLKSLESLLEQKKSSAKPRSRFAFKKAAPSKARPAPALAPAPAPSAPCLPSSAAAGVNATVNIELSSLSNAYVTLPNKLPSSGFSVSLSSISHCIINLLPAPRSLPAAPRPPPITALHIQDVTSCLLLAPNIEGSVLINGFDGCTLDVGCWQLRMHRARQTDVFVRMTGEQGTPVIEDCEGVRFGPRLLGGSLTAASEPLTVLDFSHPNPTEPSPHFRLLASDELDPLRQLLSRVSPLEDEWAADRIAAVLQDCEASRGTADER